MKVLLKSAIIFVLLMFCLPAHGEILIYKETIKCLTASEDDELWEVEDEIVRGYLIIDLNYNQNGTPTAVVDANQIEYQVRGRNKWYYQWDHWFDFSEIEMEKGVLWVLMEKYTDDIEGEIFVLTGQARDTRIGLGKDEPRSVAKAVEGEILADWITGVGILQICEVSLRLQSKWTKRANDANEGNQDFDYAVSDIVMAYLDDKGYQYVRQ